MDDKRVPCPFTQSVVEAMESLYPTSLADTKWDNVGLLLGNHKDEKHSGQVMLTVDLTRAVAEEAVRNGVRVIIAYHPFIFRGLKSVTHKDTQQSTLLHLAYHNIAVYTPHTALDASGLNHWLMSTCLEGSQIPPDMIEDMGKPLQPVANGSSDVAAAGPPKGYGLKLTAPDNSAFTTVGMILKSLRAQPTIEFANVAFRQPDTLERVMGREVKSLAVCAGSGGDVFGECEADVLVTGEMTHHVALRFVERGQVVVCVMHTSSERGFLEEVRGALEGRLGQGCVGVSGADREIWGVFTG